MKYTEKDPSDKLFSPQEIEIIYKTYFNGGGRLPIYCPVSCPPYLLPSHMAKFVRYCDANFILYKSLMEKIQRYATWKEFILR